MSAPSLHRESTDSLIICESCALNEASTVTMPVHIQLMTYIAFSSGLVNSPALSQWLWPPPDCTSTNTTRGRGRYCGYGKRLVFIYYQIFWFWGEAAKILNFKLPEVKSSANPILVAILKLD